MIFLTPARAFRSLASIQRWIEIAKIRKNNCESEIEL